MLHYDGHSKFSRSGLSATRLWETMMKTGGALVGMLLEIGQENHTDFVVGEGHNKVLHARILKELCDMLLAIIFHCRKFRKDIEVECYQFNPCDI